MAVLKPGRIRTGIGVTRSSPAAQAAARGAAAMLQASAFSVAMAPLPERRGQPFSDDERPFRAPDAGQAGTRS